VKKKGENKKMVTNSSWVWASKPIFSCSDYENSSSLTLTISYGKLVDLSNCRIQYSLSISSLSGRGRCVLSEALFDRFFTCSMEMMSSNLDQESIRSVSQELKLRRAGSNVIVCISCPLKEDKTRQLLNYYFALTPYQLKLMFDKAFRISGLIVASFLDRAGEGWKHGSGGISQQNLNQESNLGSGDSFSFDNTSSLSSSSLVPPVTASSSSPLSLPKKDPSFETPQKEEEEDNKLNPPTIQDEFQGHFYQYLKLGRGDEIDLLSQEVTESIDLFGNKPTKSYSYKENELITHIGTLKDIYTIWTDKKSGSFISLFDIYRNIMNLYQKLDTRDSISSDLVISFFFGLLVDRDMIRNFLDLFSRRLKEVFDQRASSSSSSLGNEDYKAVFEDFQGLTSLCDKNLRDIPLVARSVFDSLDDIRFKMYMDIESLLLLLIFSNQYFLNSGSCFGWLNFVTSLFTCIFRPFYLLVSTSIKKYQDLSSIKSNSLKILAKINGLEATPSNVFGQELFSVVSNELQSNVKKILQDMTFCSLLVDHCKNVNLSYSDISKSVVTRI